MIKVLVIDDDEVLRNSLALYLDLFYFFTFQAATASEGIREYYSKKPHVIILDLGLPDKNGIYVLHEIRKVDQKIPIIIVTANSSEKDQILALNLAADDYLVKPVNFDLLLARLKNLMNHIRIPSQEGSFECRELNIDYSNRNVLFKGKMIELTNLQYDILALMTKYAGRLLEHEFIIENIWKENEGDINSLRVEIQRIRQKIEDDPKNPQYITSKYGVGYRFNTIDSTNDLGI